MGITIAVPEAYGDARECIRAARLNMRRAKEVLSKPDFQGVDESAAILREVDVQLGCAAAFLKQSHSKPDAEIQDALIELQNDIAVLALFLAQADKLLNGWLQAIGTRRAGYTQQGDAAPLILINKVQVEG